MGKAGDVDEVGENGLEASPSLEAVSSSVCEEQLDLVVVQVISHQAVESLEHSLLQGDVVVVDDLQKRVLVWMWCSHTLLPPYWWIRAVGLDTLGMLKPAAETR